MTRLSLNDYLSLSPLIILLFTGLIILLLESFAPKTSKKSSFFIAFSGTLFALISLFFSPPSTNPLLSNFLNFDATSLFFASLFLVTGLLVELLTYAFFKHEQTTVGEYYFLLLSALFGLMLIGYAADFLTIFLGLETLSISLYVLCGYIKKWEISSEASIKYFILGSLSTACFVFGVALLYGANGTTSLSLLSNGFTQLNADPDKFLFFSGTAFLTLGLAFKAAIAPFHFWAPDVYQGAPYPLTAFMATGTKVGAFAAFARVFVVELPNFDSFWNQGMTLLAYVTLVYANFLALRQIDLKRFFAYSGISHAGLLLIPIIASNQDSLYSLEFYLVVYTFATLGCFAVLSTLNQGHGQNLQMSDLQGLFYRSPWLAAFFSITLLTLAGIPPTAGFFAKFYIFKVAFQEGYYGLVIVGLLTSILSAFYYLRIVSYFFTHPTEAKAQTVYSKSAVSVALIAVAFILWLSVYPAPLMAILSK